MRNTRLSAVDVLGGESVLRAFATACAKQGLRFIGPMPEVITAMGDKENARRARKTLDRGEEHGTKHE